MEKIKVLKEKGRINVFEKVKAVNSRGKKVDAFVPCTVKILEVETNGNVVNVIKENGNFYNTIDSKESLLTLADLMGYNSDTIVKMVYQKTVHVDSETRKENYELRPVELVPIYVVKEAGEFYTKGFKRILTLGEVQELLNS